MESSHVSHLTSYHLLEINGMDLTGARVLLVDDQPENLDVLVGVMEPEGYSIQVGLSGRVALDLARRVVPDLILLDVMMPGMDGFETCRRLKEDPETRDIPVIFLTAKTETEDLVKGFELGAVDYVTKPFNATELLVRVNTHLALRKTQQELVQRLEEIDRMKREHEAFLRHELRNRIAPLMGYSDMLMQVGDEEISDRCRRWASIISRESDNMSSLIDALKDMQDLEAGRFDLREQPVELVAIIKQVVENLEAVFGDRVEIRCDDSGGESMVLGDPVLLDGVFQNLIKNGAEHVNHLTDSAERVVNVKLYNENRQVVVSVNNGGAPVPAERLATFFEKFNTDKKGGTGLGTTYAYMVARAHGGEITIRSNTTEGTTVTVTLPQMS